MRRGGRPLTPGAAARHDRRVRRLHPTEAGLDVMRGMDSMFGRALGVVLKSLSVEDLDLLLRGARAVLTALERLQADESA